MKVLGKEPFFMSLGAVPPCINSTAQTNWLNRGDVRKALHIVESPTPWDLCRYVGVAANLIIRITFYICLKSLSTFFI